MVRRRIQVTNATDVAWAFVGFGLMWFLMGAGLSIAPKEKRKIQQLTEQSNAFIEQVEQEIEQETEELLEQE